MDLRISDKKPKPKMPIHVYYKENLKHFLIETSLNGLKYIEDVKRNIWERSYYLISFTIVFTAGIYMAVYFFQNWHSTPVLISMSSRATSIQEIPFPTVTFCNMNQISLKKVGHIPPTDPEYAILKKICFQDHNFTQYNNFKRRFEGDTVVNFILKNAQSCSDMIIYCKFGPNEETCSDLFREVFLDEGICCVFNQLHPFFMFKGDIEFTRDYTASNGRSIIPVDWSLENGYPKELPKIYYPRRAAGSGVSMGLTVVLNAGIDDYYCSSTNGQGFKTLLYNPVDTPHIKDSGLPIMVGHQTRMRINSKLMEALPSLRKIEPKDRQCYFSGEKSLLYFKSYTRRNCEMECDARHMLRHCNCVEYHMPLIYENTSTCFLDEMDCVVNTDRLLFDAENAKCKEECLSGCHELLFFPDLFVSPLATKNFNLQDPFFRNMSKDLMRNNLALVQIYYTDSFFRGNTKVPYTGFTEFMSQTGGIMSLMVGFSVISIAEIIYFILLKPFIDKFLPRNPAMLRGKKNDNIIQVDTSKDNLHHELLFNQRRTLTNPVMKWNHDVLQKYKDDNDKY